MVGLILGTTGNRANVLIDNLELHLSVPGRWRQKSGGVRPLAPGDRVALEKISDDLRIVEILPRENDFTRQAAGLKPIPQTMAVNLDQVIIVASAANPATPTGLIDRLLVTAARGDVPAVLIINKIDIADNERLSFLQRVYHNAVEIIILTSALTGIGIDRFRDLIIDKITLLAGSSGVGKSTLVNYIDPDLNIKTDEVSRVTGKGRHITSVARLHPLKQGGWIIDTPGLRECQLWDVTQQSLGQCFREFIEFASDCHFRDCLHNTEIGCAVKSVVDTDILPMERYMSYLKLLKEINIK
ncbi:MAG: ribosome small subunit-dependent GTPase A [Candidatus Hatepunaea meridiana]|nr:ribosome small subunit-dependent GTPase A [Candidatus Hatepunaea meridiana]